MKHEYGRLEEAFLIIHASRKMQPERVRAIIAEQKSLPFRAVGTETAIFVPQ